MLGIFLFVFCGTDPVACGNNLWFRDKPPAAARASSVDDAKAYIDALTVATNVQTVAVTQEFGSNLTILSAYQQGSHAVLKFSTWTVCVADKQVSEVTSAMVESLIAMYTQAKTVFDALPQAPLPAPADRKAKEEADRKAKEKSDRKVKEEADRKAKEEADRKAKEETDRKAKEEADRKAKEEADRKAKEEADRKAKEEADCKAKEEADRKAKEETDRKAKEEADRKVREEADRKAKEEADRKAEEEADRKAKEAVNAENPILKGTDGLSQDSLFIRKFKALSEQKKSEFIEKWNNYTDEEREKIILKFNT